MPPKSSKKRGRNRGGAKCSQPQKDISNDNLSSHKKDDILEANGVCEQREFSIPILRNAQDRPEANGISLHKEINGLKIEKEIKPSEYHNRGKALLLTLPQSNSSGISSGNPVVTGTIQKTTHSLSSISNCQIAGDVCLPSRPNDGNAGKPIKLVSDNQAESSDCLPCRPNYGNTGKPIKLFANHFLINFPHGNVYHYDVNITEVRKQDNFIDGISKKVSKTPRQIPNMTSCKIVEKVFKSEAIFRNFLPVYDGRRNLYTRRLLPLLAPETFLAKLEENGQYKNYQVTIKPVQKDGKNNCAVSFEPLHDYLAGKKSTIPYETIAALDIILRHKDMPLSVVTIRRSFFPFTESGLHPLEGGSEIWFGYYQSARAYEKGLMLNIDMAATTFFKSGPVLDYVRERLNRDVKNGKALSDAEIRKLSKELKGLQVKVTHMQYHRKYRVFKVAREPVNFQVFSMNIENRITKKKVIDYFYQQYNYRVKYPHLPCLQMNPPSKEVYIPMEVCEIVEGQHYRLKLSGMQTSKMIRQTARSPEDRFKHIQQSVESLNKNISPYAKEFGLQINTAPLQLQGRVLPPPAICYKGEKFVMPNKGSWDMRQQQFLTAASVGNWIILNFSQSCSPDILKTFARNLCDVSCDYGLRLGEPKMLKYCDEKNNLEKILKAAKEGKAEMVVVVLGSRGSRQSLHDEIKFIAETKLGLLTQCVLDTNIKSKSRQYLGNLCQKINAKMGGVNCILKPNVWPSIFKKPVIIIGADVNHPAPGDTVKPSIAAVVGSMDNYPAKYSVSLRVQISNTENGKRKEIIQDLKGMMREVLIAFYRNTNKLKPEKIIFYRDGVGEGQFLQVRHKEIAQIQEACQSLQTDYRPTLTFISVQKRHHTRFRPYDPKDGVGKCGNVPPGTTVDTDVVQPQLFDFFLCSHEGIQGTSRPAYYVVLWDDNKFTPDEMQKLTFYLCHTYARCTRSVSIPAPVYYAHLAAFRAKEYLSSMSESSSSSSGSSDSSPTLNFFTQCIAVSDDVKNRMFFI